MSLQVAIIISAVIVSASSMISSVLYARILHRVEDRRQEFAERMWLRQEALSSGERPNG